MEINDALESIAQLVLSGDIDNIRIARKIALNSEEWELKSYIYSWEAILRQKGKDYTNPAALASFINEVQAEGFAYTGTEMDTIKLDVLVPIVKRLIFSFSLENELDVVLNKFKTIESLIIYAVQTPLLELNFEPLTELKELIVSDQVDFILNKSIAYCTQLKTLCIHSPNLISFPKEITLLSNLVEIEYVLTENNPIATQKNKNSLNFLLELKQLKELIIDSKIIEYYQYNIEKLCNLEFLEVIQDTPIDKIAVHYISKLKNLLKLTFNGIIYFKEWGNQFANLTKLTDLIFHNCTLDDINFYSLRFLPLKNIIIDSCRSTKLNDVQLKNLLGVYCPNAQIDIY